MTIRKDFIFVSSERYLEEMGYDSVEDWAIEAGYRFDETMDSWVDDEDTVININQELRYYLDDSTWGWDVRTHALDQEYKMNIDGDYYVDRNGRSQVYPEAELIEQFFDDEKAIRNDRIKRMKEAGNE